MLRKLLFWSCTVVFPLPLALTYDAVSTDPVQVKFFILIGLISYGLWLLSVLLSVRPSWLDRFVGLPSIYGLHGALGLLAVAAAYVHRENTYSPSPLARDLGNWAFYGALGVLLFSVFFMSGWLVDRSSLLLKAKKLLEIPFRRQLSLWIHRLNLVIIGAIWLHAHLLVRVNRHFGFMILFDLYTVTVLGIYAWKKWISPDTFLTGSVAQNSALGGGTRRLSVKLDSKSATLQPGDFFFLRFEGSSVVSREWHPFSVSDDERETLTFTIRQHGDFTRRIGDVEPGTRLRLEGPFGRFGSIIQQCGLETPLVLLGLGAGVAPLMSLTAAHHTTRRIHLLWAVRSPEDAYYADALKGYEKASGGQFKVTIKTGRFRAEDFARALTTREVKKGSFFIVGPNHAVLANQRLLRKMGVFAGRIHQERLTM
ncbi:FAD-binding oxidoreductase [Streptomyces chartreusis]